MNHYRAKALARIVLAEVNNKWWDSLTPQQQKVYLEEHPDSKYARNHRVSNGQSPFHQEGNPLLEIHPKPKQADDERKIAEQRKAAKEAVAPKPSKPEPKGTVHEDRESYERAVKSKTYQQHVSNIKQNLKYIKSIKEQLRVAEGFSEWVLKRRLKNARKALKSQYDQLLKLERE